MNKRQATRSTRATAQPAAPKHEKEIRAEQFTVVNEQGEMRARLYTHGTSTVFAMYDAAGNLRLAQRCDERGEVSLSIFESRPSTEQLRGDIMHRLRIGCIPRADGGEPVELTFFDAEENQRLQLMISPEGEGRMHFLGKRGATEMVLNSDGLTIYEGDEVMANVGKP